MAHKAWTSLITATALSLPVAAVAALGRKMTAWKDPKQRDLTLSRDHSAVTLDADAKTTATGTYGVLIKGAHIRVGKVISQDLDHGKVTREVLAWSGPRVAGKMRGAWTGQTLASPEQLEMDFTEISLGDQEGTLPAWLFRPENPANDVWAIHVHGLRSSRNSMLRSVPAAAKLGMVSLIPSFFGDAENHDDGQACHFGSMESSDVEKALEYAVAHGAKALYLFGWSMGATISLLLTETSKYRQLIAGLILVSPGPDTRAVLAVNARTAGLPRLLAELVPSILSTPLLSRLSSLTSPVDFVNLAWTDSPGRLQVPTLALHSRGDTEVPFSLTAKFARLYGDLVTLKEFAAVPHQCEWNSSPERFEHEVKEWVLAVEGKRKAPRR